MGFKEKLRKFLKIDPRVMRKMRKILAPIRRIGIKKEFTLFADNCWGGRLYDKFSLQYKTPTIGLAIKNEQFVKFLYNIDYYLSLSLEPIEETQKRVNSEWGFYDCRLGDLVIEFRHYRNAGDAIDKWDRRKNRIVKDNIIVKMTYYDQIINEELINKFIDLPYKKILFTSNEQVMKYNKINRCRVVYIPIEKKDSEFLESDKRIKLKEIKKIINE